MKKVLLNLVLLFALVCFAEAQEFKVADIFSDNMVLQQKIIIRFGVGENRERK